MRPGDVFCYVYDRSGVEVCIHTCAHAPPVVKGVGAEVDGGQSVVECRTIDRARRGSDKRRRGRKETRGRAGKWECGMEEGGRVGQGGQGAGARKEMDGGGRLKSALPGREGWGMDKEKGGESHAGYTSPLSWLDISDVHLPRPSSQVIPRPFKQVVPILLPILLTLKPRISSLQSPPSPCLLQSTPLPVG
eukprot:360288-Chlamydomonas_euryale.AAC.3